MRGSADKLKNVKRFTLRARIIKWYENNLKINAQTFFYPNYYCYIRLYKLKQPPMDIKKTYDALVAEARSRNLPCKIKRHKSSITIEVGMDAPDEVDGKAFRAIEALGFSPNDNTFSICAEEYGWEVLESTNVAGGPKNYRANKYGSSSQLINLLSRGRY